MARTSPLRCRIIGRIALASNSVIVEQVREAALEIIVVFLVLDEIARSAFVVADDLPHFYLPALVVARADDEAFDASLALAWQEIAVARGVILPEHPALADEGVVDDARAVKLERRLDRGDEHRLGALVFERRGHDAVGAVLELDVEVRQNLRLLIADQHRPGMRVHGLDHLVEGQRHLRPLDRPLPEPLFIAGEAAGPWRELMRGSWVSRVGGGITADRAEPRKKSFETPLESLGGRSAGFLPGAWAVKPRG